MKIGDWFDDITDMADAAEKVSGEYLRKPFPELADMPRVATAFSANSARLRLEVDPELDWRMATQSVCASVWRRTGGVRFVLSDSVAASFALTKQPTDPLELPFGVFMIQVPRGYMPSQLGDECEGLILVAAHNDWFYCSCFAARPERSGSRVLVFPQDADESVEAAAPRVTAAPEIQAASTELGESSARLVIRIVRNFAAWIRAFPVREVVGKTKRKQEPNDDLGVTEGSRGLYYLRTTVKMDAEMRRAAREMMRAGSSFAAKKMAARHIVRGHWKRQVVKDGRKMIFVAPYWRGPDGPAAWGRVYKLFGENALPNDVN